MRSVPLHEFPVRNASSSRFNDARRKMLKRSVYIFNGMNGLKTLISKEALSKVPPLTTVSKRAPSCLFTEAVLNDSLVMGRRLGSVATP